MSRAMTTLLATTAFAALVGLATTTQMLAQSSDTDDVPGAETAPVAPGAAGDEQGTVTMTGPETDPTTDADSTDTEGETTAQSDEEADCPEDFDTAPGCDMTPASDDDTEVQESEAQPIPGAATAPTAPDADSEDGDKSLAAPAAEVTDQNESDGDGESQTVEVTARGVQFVSAIIYIEPGDTVRWTNMASHNVETIEAMSPDGQEKVNSEIGANISQTFETEGVLVYKCTPHWGNRMGGIIVVGQPENPGEIIDRYMQAAEENPENLPALGLLKDLRADMEEKSLING